MPYVIKPAATAEPAVIIILFHGTAGTGAAPSTLTDVEADEPV